MEIDQLATEGNIYLYFGKIDQLEEEEHFLAYKKVYFYMLNCIRPFSAKMISITLESPLINYKLSPTIRKSMFSKKYIYEIPFENLNSESMAEKIYYSHNSEVVIQSKENYKAILSFDPVVLSIDF